MKHSVSPSFSQGRHGRATLPSTLPSEPRRPVSRRQGIPSSRTRPPNRLDALLCTLWAGQFSRLSRTINTKGFIGIATPRPASDACRFPALGPPSGTRRFKVHRDHDPAILNTCRTGQGDATGRETRMEREFRPSQEARCAVAQVRRSLVAQPRPDEICSVCPVSCDPQDDDRSVVLYLSD